MAVDGEVLSLFMPGCLSAGAAKRTGSVFSFPRSSCGAYDTDHPIDNGIFLSRSSGEDKDLVLSSLVIAFESHQRISNFLNLPHRLLIFRVK